MRTMKNFFMVLFVLLFIGCQSNVKDLPTIHLQDTFKTCSLIPTTSSILLLCSKPQTNTESLYDLYNYNYKGVQLHKNRITAFAPAISMVDTARNDTHLYFAWQVKTQKNEECIWITKMTLDNKIVWNKQLSLQDTSLYPASMSVTQQDDIFLTGSFQKDENSSVDFIVQLDESGSVKNSTAITVSPSGVPFGRYLSVNLYDTTIDQEGNLYFTGFSDSIGESSMYWETGLFGKVDSSGNLVFLHGLMKNGKKGFTQCKDIQWLPDKRIWISGISGNTEGLYILECSEQGDLTRTLSIPDYPSTSMPHVIANRQHCIVAKTIQENGKDNLMILNLSWKENSPSHIEDVSWYPNLADKYTTQLLSTFHYRDNIVFPLYQEDMNSITFLQWDSATNTPFFGSFPKEDYLAAVSCHEIDDMITENLLEGGTLLTEDIEIHVESADNSILME